MGMFIVDTSAILPLAEIFEKDSKKCVKYNSTCHKLLEYTGFIDTYRVDEYGVNEEYKPIICYMQKAFDSLPPNLEAFDFDPVCPFSHCTTLKNKKPDDLRTFLMKTYPRNDGGNEINDAFRYSSEIWSDVKMTVFDAIAIINRAFALINMYTSPVSNTDYYNPIYITKQLQSECQYIYKKYCYDISFMEPSHASQIRIISFLISILKCIYMNLKLFDELFDKGVKWKEDVSQCPLVIVLMPKILVAANQLSILKTHKIELELKPEIRRLCELNELNNLYAQNDKNT